MARTAPSSQSAAHLLPWISFSLSIAVLYFAKEIFIPVALATLLTFLLTPVVRCLERWGLGRVAAVVFVLILSLSSMIGIAWMVSNQLLDVINQLPAYKENIHRKLDAVHGPKDGILNKTTDSVQELTKELNTTPPTQPGPSPKQPARSTKQVSPLKSGVQPVAVEIVPPPLTALQSLRDILGPVIAPLSTILMVIVFSIFMLMKREDLRNRFIRLVAKRHLNVMTQAMDDAGQRVSRYLLMQFIVNTAFGALIAGGLYLIGVPNALLWGAMGATLRFFPYVGPLIAGAFPFVLALAVFGDWTRPLLTAGLFLAIELATANVIEPRLYGAHTGISSLAILIAAIFWTVLWGPVGLVLSTPLTVCLLVMGRYVPQLEFLHILLGDEPVLPPEAQFYQRLLAMDQKEAQTVSETFLKEKSLINLYDEVIIPALAMAEQDRHQGLLKPANEAFIVQGISELIIELASYVPEPSSNPVIEAGVRPRVICLGANDQADELTATMFAQVLEQAGFSTTPLLATDSTLSLFDEISNHPNDVVCICALPPFAILHARTLCKKIRTRFPELRIIVGLWNLSEGGVKIQDRLGKAFADPVVTTLKQAVEELCISMESESSESRCAERVEEFASTSGIGRG